MAEMTRSTPYSSRSVELAASRWCGRAAMNSKPCRARRTTARRPRPAGARARRAATNADDAAEAAFTNVTAPTPVSLASLSVVLSNGAPSGDSRMERDAIRLRLVCHQPSSAIHAAERRRAVPRAVKIWGASVVPTHLVGWISQA